MSLEYQSTVNISGSEPLILTVESCSDLWSVSSVKFFFSFVQMIREVAIVHLSLRLHVLKGDFLFKELET